MRTEAGHSAVGPNAVTQTAAALRAIGGEALALKVFAAGGLAQVLAAPPEKIGDQDLAPCLHNALRLTLDPQGATLIAAGARHRTADYLLAHRAHTVPA